MPSMNLRRAIGAALTASLMVSASGAASASEAPIDAAIAPPSLEAAVATLQASSVLSATESAAVLGLAAKRLPACGIRDQRTRYGEVKHWRKTLLDTNLKVKRTYRPWDLVSVSRANIKGSGKVRKVMIADLKALAAAARGASKPLAVRSAYRSYDYQKALFASYVRRDGFARAATYSARPGHSEHQLGTTIDFTTAPGVPLTTRFGDSPAGKWLARNGWKHGFVMSYPKGKKKWSCYSYEPWHWRYVGRGMARQIHDSGYIPRRYLWQNFETAP